METKKRTEENTCFCSSSNHILPSGKVSHCLARPTARSSFASSVYSRWQLIGVSARWPVFGRPYIYRDEVTALVRGSQNLRDRIVFRTVLTKRRTSYVKLFERVFEIPYDNLSPLCSSEIFSSSEIFF